MNLAPFAEALGRQVKARLDPLHARIAALEATVADLQARCAAAEAKAAAAGEKYRGIFQRAQAEDYPEGSWTTHKGSMWVALRAGPGVPGEGDGWQLAVQRGSDGRHAQ